LLRFDAILPKMARGLIVAYRDPMKRVDANTVLAQAIRALDELARTLTGNDKGPRSTLMGFSAKENKQWAIREAYRDSVLSARIQIRCDALVSLVG
jgi:hypothetical protein